MTSYLDTTPEQIKAFIDLPTNGPLQMLNLLKFKDHVAETGLSGEEQYKKYMQAVLPFIQAANGKLLYSGRPQMTLIGPNELEWDKVVIVAYASKQDFIGMSQAVGFPAKMRTLALADSRLIFCSPA